MEDGAVSPKYVRCGSLETFLCKARSQKSSQLASWGLVLLFFFPFLKTAAQDTECFASDWFCAGSVLNTNSL